VEIIVIALVHHINISLLGSFLYLPLFLHVYKNLVFVTCWLQSGRKATPFGIARNLQQIGSTLMLVFIELATCIRVEKVYKCLCRNLCGSEIGLFF